MSEPEEKKPVQATPIQREQGSDLPGKIGEQLGTGSHAKANLAYTALRWGFIFGSVSSFGFYLLLVLVGKTEDITVAGFVAIWTPFISVISGALGFAIGQQSK